MNIPIVYLKCLKNRQEEIFTDVTYVNLQILHKIYHIDINLKHVK